MLLIHKPLLRFNTKSSKIGRIRSDTNLDLDSVIPNRDKISNSQAQKDWINIFLKKNRYKKIDDFPLRNFVCTFLTVTAEPKEHQTTKHSFSN